MKVIRNAVIFEAEDKIDESLVNIIHSLIDRHVSHVTDHEAKMRAVADSQPAGKDSGHYAAWANDSEIVPPPAKLAPPRIGSEWPEQGGIYAGLMRGRDGGEDYHLIVALKHSAGIDWHRAMDWAECLGVSSVPRKDFTLPYRAEQALLFANVPELFENDGYWSREQRAEDADYAWVQYFGYGYQVDYHKDNEWRARAVRRVAA